MVCLFLLLLVFLLFSYIIPFGLSIGARIVLLLLGLSCDGLPPSRNAPHRRLIESMRLPRALYLVNNGFGDFWRFLSDILLAEKPSLACNYLSARHHTDLCQLGVLRGCAYRGTRTCVSRCSRVCKPCPRTLYFMNTRYERAAFNHLFLSWCSVGMTSSALFWALSGSYLNLILFAFLFWDSFGNWFRVSPWILFNYLLALSLQLDDRKNHLDGG